MTEAMNDMRSLVKAEYLGGYKIRVTFDNGKVKVRDFEEEIIRFKDSEIVKPLTDQKYFKKFKIVKNYGGLKWPNGYDCCPNWLYSNSTEVKRKRS